MTNMEEDSVLRRWTTEQLKQIEDLLNNRPRKVLNYKTPKEVFNECVALAH